jgi:hypothetical protein
MSGAQSRPRWLFLLRPRWMGWHAFAGCAVAAMLWLGDWQLQRAEAGNPLSWAYTVEWPLFAIFGVVFWAKTIRDEVRAGSRSGDRDADAADGPAAAATADDRSGAPAARSEDEPELDAYNSYLARLNEEVRGHGRWHGLR